MMIWQQYIGEVQSSAGQIPKFWFWYRIFCIYVVSLARAPANIGSLTLTCPKYPGKLTKNPVRMKCFVLLFSFPVFGATKQEEVWCYSHKGGEREAIKSSSDIQGESKSFLPETAGASSSAPTLMPSCWAKQNPPPTHTHSVHHHGPPNLVHTRWEQAFIIPTVIMTNLL